MLKQPNREAVVFRKFPQRQQCRNTLYFREILTALRLIGNVFFQAFKAFILQGTSPIPASRRLKNHPKQPESAHTQNNKTEPSTPRAVCATK
ncbi:hypothetical protein [Eikenella corrodens]|uniref:hypothetical protein n=1 Tax=Eikenella corrodens TaxID=539 RepID=UPI0019D1E7C5|nr:hypothetical protein [Eikenella corrodens]